jgi:hypothetical protein
LLDIEASDVREAIEMTFRSVGSLARDVLRRIEMGAPGNAPLEEQTSRALAQDRREDRSAHMLTVEGTTGAMGMEKDGAKLASRPVKFMEEVSQPSRAASPPVLRLVISRKLVNTNGMRSVTAPRRPTSTLRSPLVLVWNGHAYSPTLSR